MPGIPRSQACQTCKKKRIKCDQSWPTCAPCLRSNSSCPGPSSLTKFIHQGEHRASSLSSAEQAACFASPESLARSPPATGKLITRGQTSKYDHGISVSVMRLQHPRAQPPTTSAERLAVRLAGLLKNGLDAGVRRNMSYLPHLPQRLDSSTCLRDCTALFCAAWVDYRRRRPPQELLSPKLYGKALRSLGKALKGDQAFTVETLGAVTLLERAENLFGVGQVRHLETHYNGIKHVMQKKGAPNFKDKLDIGLAYENQAILFVLSLVGDDNYMMKENWEEIQKEAIPPYIPEMGLECFPDRFLVIHEGLPKWAEWLQEVRLVRGDPGKMEYKKVELLQILDGWDRRVEDIIQGTIDKASSTGFLREVPDTELFTSARYEFRSIIFAQLFAAALLLHVVIRRLIYDIGVLYDAPDEALYSRYRDVCIKLWMFFPYISTLDPLSAADMLSGLYLTLEAADDSEQDCVLDAFLSIDSYQQRFPRDKKALREAVLCMTEYRFGRSEPTEAATTI